MLQVISPAGSGPLYQFPRGLPPTPGIYPGPGQATLLRPGEYVYLLNNTPIVAAQSSIAVQLERTKSGFFYPIGFSMEISFSGAPGPFEADCQTSDTDQDSFFAKNTSVSTVTANNVARIEMTNYWALFTRVSFSTLTNAVTVTVKITR